MEEFAAMGFLRVAIDVPLPQLFDYRCDGASPKDIGLRVVVPFGSRKLVGIIFDVVASSDLPQEKLRAAGRILRDMPPLAGAWLPPPPFLHRCFYYRPAP